MLIIGKFLENIKKHMDVAFVRSRNVLRKHCAKNSFQGVRRISSSVCMVFSKPDSIVLSKFPWIGVAILDIRYVQKTFLKLVKKLKKNNFHVTANGLCLEAGTTKSSLYLVLMHTLEFLSETPVRFPIYFHSHC